jgi:CBS domain-containing protein
MRVADVMTSEVSTVMPNTTLVHVAQMMADLDIGVIPIVEMSQLVGLVTDRDIVVRALATGMDPGTTPARDIMSAPVISASPDIDIEEAVDLMEEHQIRRLPVLDNGKLVGIIAFADLAVDVGDEQLAGEALSEVSQPAEPSLDNPSSSQFGPH